MFFWEINVDLVYTHVAPDVAGVLGYTPDEIVGRSLFDLLLPNAVDQILDLCLFARVNQQPFFNFETTHIGSNGQLVTLETFAVELLDAQGTFLGYRGIHQDIGDRLQLQQAFQQTLQRDRWMQSMTRIRQSLNLRQILDTTIHEVRTLLNTDRVLLYCFQPKLTENSPRYSSENSRLTRMLEGVIVAETAREDWGSQLGSVIEAAYTSEHYVKGYQQGEITAIADIHEAYLEPWQRHLLGRYDVRALLIVPILQQEHLWGLLVVHHCSTPRKWHSLEIDVLQQMATEVGIAIHQSECYQVLEQTNRELHRLVRIDELTQVDNRRSFEEYLHQQWETLAHTQDSLGLILCDVDYFKFYNDTYGHLAGDRCLIQVASAIKRTIQRSTDLVARYGGEEFAIILPHTQLPGVLQIAKRISQEIQAANIAHLASPVKNQVTLSLGLVSMVADRSIPITDLIASADRALYRAKDRGRDRIVVGTTDFPNNSAVSAS